jgi:polyisoprenoid-binding protein YceI
MARDGGDAQMSARGRRRLRWTAVGVGVLVVVGVGGPFVYIHFIEGPAPAKLSLPKSASTAKGTATPTTSSQAANLSANAAGAPATSSSVSGTWNVGAGSVVGYRVQEVLIGQNSTAVGRTSEVWGSLAISRGHVAEAAFTANMASVKSDQSGRNAQFDNRIMDVTAYPTARFQLAAGIPLGSLPPTGAAKAYHGTGDLTMHGVTRPIHFTISAERESGSIYALADINIVFADWKIANPSIGGFVTTQDHGTLEVLLHLTKGIGNPSYASTNVSPANPGPPGASGTGGFHGGPPPGKFSKGKFPGGKFPGGKFPGRPGGGGFRGGPPGGNVTVPKTTVPPLTVPSR